MTQREETLRSGGGAPRAEWPLTLALLLLVLVGCSALGPLLSGSAWWWAMALVATVVLVASAVLRQFGVAKSLGPVAALGVLLATITLLFGGGSALFWLLPVPETFGRFQGLIDSGIDSIMQQSTPAEATDGILFLLAVGAGLIAILMDILAITLRWPALAGLPMLVPVAVPGLLVENGASSAALILTAAAFLVLLRVDVRARRSAEAGTPSGGRDSPRVFAPVRRRGPGPIWGSITVGSIGIVSALVLSTATPALTEGGLAGLRGNGQLFGSGISPMIDLSQDLRRPQAAPAFHYTTTADRQPYFKLVTLDQFTGQIWAARNDPTDSRNTVDNIETPPGLFAGVKTTEAKTSVVIDGVETTWLPAPSPATSIGGLNGNWYWNTRVLTIKSPDSSTRGQQYTVTALELEPTAEQLRGSNTNYPASIAPNLDLPFPRPDIIDETARAVTAGATSAYDAAVALQDYLRGSEFTYDTEAPVEDGFDGGGVDVIGAFLEVKRGYCVQFASTMAIMARTLGIPARLSLGYLPGTPSSNIEQAPDRFEVDSHDLHAWPELYFVGIGWVPFEPTPGRGTVPEYARPADTSTPESTPDASLPTSAPRSIDDGPIPDAGTFDGSTSQADEGSNLLRLSLILALVLLILLAPGGVRGLRRALRRHRIRSGIGGAAVAWAELTDTALDHGVQVRDTETPRELARHISTLEGVAGASGVSGVAGEDVVAALWRLLVAEERHRYDRPGTGSAPDAGAPLVHDLDRVIRAIHTGAELRTRLLATALPVSLWPTVLGNLHSTRTDRAPAEA